MSAEYTAKTQVELSHQKVMQKSHFWCDGPTCFCVCSGDEKVTHCEGLIETRSFRKSIVWLDPNLHVHDLIKGAVYQEAWRSVL